MDHVLMFTAKNLGIADAAVAYPLVACSYPHLSQQRWSEYVERSATGAIPERLVGMVDGRGRYHAIFAYRVGAQAAAGRLRVSHIATFQLAGNAIFKAFHHALDTLARENNCREVVINPWALADERAAAPRPPVPAGLVSRVLSIGPAAEPARSVN